MSLVAHMLLVTTLEGSRALAPAGSDIEIAPTETKYIEAKWGETIIRGAPWVPHRRIATISGGTRLKVRGLVKSRDDEGCHGKDWYAVLPYGFVCSEHAAPTKQAPTLAAALPLDEGRRVPFNYAWVKENGAPMYASVDDIKAFKPSRPLEKGMSLVGARTVEVEGREYLQTWDGRYVPKPSIRWGGQGSDWSGVLLTGDEEQLAPGPAFAWVTGDNTRVYAKPQPGAAVVAKLDRRERVPLLEYHAHMPQTGGQRVTHYYRVAEGQWVKAEGINEVHILAPPRGVLDHDRVEATGNDQWIDVDVGEQVLVAYRGTTPVFATLISSGKGNKTPLGNYPIWAKVAAMDMGNQPYEDNAYLVQGVPWVLLFQGHNALHGAYWHDRFGVKKSHGCVNLAPQDARFMFEWVAPILPEGWTGYLPQSLERSVVVHVRDSSRGQDFEFTQERQIGPPDREAEKERTLAAQERRETEMGVVPPSPTYNDPYNPRPELPDGPQIPGDAQARPIPRGPRLGPDGKPLPPDQQPAPERGSGAEGSAAGLPGFGTTPVDDSPS